ncbi:MAG: hypothetical protein FJX62_07630 [Alphaproteobacteria bacterium]|nr:hypothetical protein [Alphaproteobacteria bacterium]
MIGKILIAALATATLFIATANAAVVADGRTAEANSQPLDAKRSESIRYDGIPAPNPAVRQAAAISAGRHQF